MSSSFFFSSGQRLGDFSLYSTIIAGILHINISPLLGLSKFEYLFLALVLGCPRLVNYYFTFIWLLISILQTALYLLQSFVFIAPSSSAGRGQNYCQAVEERLEGHAGFLRLPGRSVSLE